MSFVPCLSRLLLAVSLIFNGAALARGQSSSSSSSLTLSDSSAETSARAVVEKYFTLYANKDLNGLMDLWSRQSPDYAAAKQALEKVFAAESITIGSPAISRMKIEGERASLRLAIELTVTDRQNRQSERQVRSFRLIREAGDWKVWQNTSAFDELAASLTTLPTAEARPNLLAEEKELVDPELIKALNRLGDRKDTEGKYSEALELLEVTIQIAERIGDLNGKADARRNQGKVHLNQGRYEQAGTVLQESLRLFEATGDKAGVAAALNDVAYVYQMQDRTEEALEAYSRSKKLSEEGGRRDRAAVASASIGGLYIQESRYDLALEYLRESLKMAEELDSRLLIGQDLSMMGMIDFFQGRYAQALARFQRSLRIREELGNRQGIALMHNRIGLVYQDLGLAKLAMECFQTSLGLFVKIGDRSNEANVLLNIGSIYSDQGDYQQALSYFQRSRQTFEEIGLKGDALKPFHNIGNIHRKQGNYDLALDTFEKCLALQEEFHDKLSVTITLKNIALTQYAKGSYTAALQAGRRALSLAREMNSLAEVWSIQEVVGRTLRRLGEVDQARESFLEAIETVDSLRRQVAGDGRQQQSFLENKLSPWLDMIDLLVAKKEYAEALTFAEKSKARVLLDVLEGGRSSLHKSLSPREQQAEEQRRLSLVTLNSELTREVRRAKPNPARLTELNEAIGQARVEYESFETNLYAAHPELRVHRGETPVVRVEELAALLPDATSALLEYVVTDDQTYLFVTTRAPAKVVEAQVRVFTLPIKRDALIRQTEAFRQQLAGRDLGFRTSALNLYALLLKPAQAELKGKTNLIVVPDDKLWDLPFQALLTGANRFLIEDAAVAYAPSLTVLREMIRRPRRSNAVADSTSLLALGNPLLGEETVERASTQRDDKPGPLPEAEKEVKALGQLYSAGHRKIYVGAEAREDRAKREAGQATILHFATHGTLNNASPMYSNLVLAAGDKNEDGLLEAWELMQLDLKADLAVLSGCETALGRYGAGEGMIGLTWAMFVAGVPSTVVSQWKVESAGTRDLMVNFHRGLISPPGAGRARLTKTEALREAAMKLLRNPETSHPFYWAGFVLVGDGR